jgi:hypothetical protein
MSNRLGYWRVKSSGAIVRAHLINGWVWIGPNRYSSSAFDWIGGTPWV